jgi:peptidoglycan/xylan/chitin deacetylase (PgdA/CDA1 family)
MDQPRDFIGYGANPPHPEWPGQAKLALNFVLNFEESSEYSIGLGDGRSETALTEVGLPRVPVGERDLASESMYEYGSRVGFWRIYRLFTERKLPLTLFGCALALENNPAVAEAVAGANWDVCCHGWRWVEHYRLSEDEERENIARAVKSLEKSLGARPLGWYCRYGPSVATRRLLIEHGGFLYDSDAYNDELPYWHEGPHSPHLIVPYTLTNNDAKLLYGGLASAESLFAIIKNAVDLLRAEGESAPKMMSVGMHARILGHPARAAALAGFLDYVAGLDDVWICRREDIARHWISRFPPDGATS